MLLSNLFIQDYQTLNENVLETKLNLVKNHSIFKGHFPEQPVLPGVCMIQISKELLQNHLGIPLVMNHSKQVKFLHVVNPNEMDYIISKIQTESQEIKGQIKLQTKIELLAPKGHSILKMQATFTPVMVPIS